MQFLTQSIKYSSTNNCAKKYQLPNHDLSSLLQLKQQSICSKSVNKFSISFKQHANHVTIYLRISRSQTINYNSTNNCSKKYQPLNHDLSSLLQLKQQYTYSKLLNKFSISFKQHANHVTIYLRMITLSIYHHTVQLTIVQRNINYQTMIFQVSYNSSSSISTANQSISSAFHSNSMQIMSQYICAWLRSQTIEYNSTNNCSKKYQLPNHDLASLIQIKQHYIYCKLLN